jgi:hypothetical protein
MTTSSQATSRGAMSIAEFGKWAGGIGKTLIYKEIGQGRLVVRKAGRRTLISYADAEQWLNERAVARPPTSNGAFPHRNLTHKSNSNGGRASRD